MQVLVGVKDLLEALLGSEGPDGPQALKRGRQVGEHGTSSCRKEHREQEVYLTLGQLNPPLGGSHHVILWEQFGSYLMLDKIDW